MPKITELSTANSVLNSDYLVMVTNPDTLAVTKKVTVNNFFSNVDILTVNNFIITNNTTPSNSSITITKGKMFYDANYLYLSTANNTLRRIPLDTF
jgi:MinD-like ATPase involved in chromosome partitioning or flagellar assembly